MSLHPLSARLAGWTALSVFVCTLALALPGGARAQEVPRLQGQITDLTANQVLAGGRTQIEAALAELLRNDNVQLFVLFAESTDGRTVTDFADEVARVNSLGGNDALLVVTTGDRTDAFWRGSESLSRLTDRELEDVLSQRVEPALAEGDFSGAVVAAADGIDDVAGEGSQRLGDSGGGGVGLWPLLLLVPAAGGGGYLVYRTVSSRRRRRREMEEARKEANALLIQADEALRDAREEAGFIEAQFGEIDVAPYRDAIARATDELMAAFKLHQQLDDGEPEDADTRHRMVGEIVERARGAQALLDEQSQRIAELRELERKAPAILAVLPARIDALEGQIPEAERTLAGLERYAEQNWASVAGNVDAAREWIDQARTAVADGQSALATEEEDRPTAGQSVRVAQQAVAEVGQVLEAIGNLATSLREEEAAIGPQLAATAADVRSARTALAGKGRTDLDRRLAEADAALQQAERALTADRPDILEAMRMVTRSDAITDEILAEIKEEEERRERERRIVAGQLQEAATSYHRAADFIAARRRMIGSDARTRLAESKRHLERAQGLSAEDTATALTEARRARELAESAYALARRDFSGTEPYGGGWAGPGWGGPVRGGTIPIPMPIPFPSRTWGRSGAPAGGRGAPSRGAGRSVGGRW